MTTALVPTEPKAITPEELVLIKNTVAVGATDAELKLFLFDCGRQGVHPLDRLIHFTKRKGKYTPITSIDFMRIRAADSGEMAGSDDAVFGLNEFRESPYPDRATVTVYRVTLGQRFSYTATARWSEYYPGDGDIGFMWRKMPHTMLGKCAEALALRKGFPRQLAGLYAREEMDQDQAEAPVLPEKHEKPAAATVENRGTLLSPDKDGHADLVDSVSGEVLPHLPPGFALIDDYRPDNNWHHITWGRDARGGSMIYKTKLAKIGNKARIAFNDRVPVKLHCNKFPWLDDVERLDDGMTPEALAATKWNPDLSEEQGF